MGPDVLSKTAHSPRTFTEQKFGRKPLKVFL